MSRIGLYDATEAS